MANVIREPCDEGIMLSREADAPCTASQARWILAATILASSIAFIDSTVVNVALPALQKDLQATAIGVQWVVEAYALFLSSLLLVGGSLGDRYGRKRVFLIGVSLLGLGMAISVAPLTTTVMSSVKEEQGGCSFRHQQRSCARSKSFGDCSFWRRDAADLRSRV